MGNFSNRKIIANQHVIEVWEYEVPVAYGFTPDKKGGRKSDGEESARKEEYREQTCRRAKWNLMRLALANFDENSKFVTLTFREDIKDVREANRRFKLFIKRLRRKYGKEFKYLSVVQFQDGKRKKDGLPGRGVVHYHFLSDLPYIPNSELADIWGQGFVKINRIDHVDNIGAYISGYMTEDVMDERLLGLKAYERSRNLTEPDVIRGQLADEVFQHLKLEDKKEVLTSSYTSEYQGKITYRQYNLKR